MYTRSSSLGLFLLSIAYNFSILKTQLGLYDEGIILVGADRILKGYIPYVDFWSIYPPGQFYTIAFLFKVFGTSVLVERVYDIAIKSLLTISVFLIVKKLDFSTKVAFICWGMSLVWINFSGFSSYPVYSAILFTFISTYFFLHFLKTDQLHWLFFSTVFISLSAIFRHDLAGMVAIVTFLTLFIKMRIEGKPFWYSMLYFIGGFLLLGLPFFIYLLNTISLQTIVKQLILIPADIMPKYRWLPYPSLSLFKIQFFVFPVIVFIGFFMSLNLIIRQKLHSKFSYELLYLSLVGILFINQVRVRSDNIHLLPVALISITIIPSLFSLIKSSSFELLTPKDSKFTAFIFLIVISLPFIKPIGVKIKSLNSDYFVLPHNPAVATAKYSEITNDLQDLILYVQSITSENDALYVGVLNHDQFVMNDVAIYFLMNRKYATRYHELHPGVTNTLSVQKEIIEEINKLSVKIIILAPRPSYEANDSRIDAKIDLLDDYIATSYKMVKQFGEYEVWAKKP